MIKVTKSISFAMFLLFFRVSLTLAVDQVYFYVTDPAGTPLAMTDSTGSVVWRADYMPFGEETIDQATVQNNKMFVGKEKDSESGLYYFGARYNDSSTGRFISPDPIGPVDPRTGNINQQILRNPQMMNPYPYAMNNPYKFKDSNGKWPTEVHNTIIRGAFSGGRYQLSPTAIAGLERGSRIADSQQYQDAAHSYMHAMTASGQSPDEAAGLTATFIADKIAEYKSLKAAGQEGNAYEALGMAMHPLMDNTSPSHEGYQEWHLIPLINAAAHKSNETVNVFNSKAEYSSKSINAIRNLYNEANK